MSAWINGILGTLSAFLIGHFWAGLTPAEVALCLVASNIAGMTALLSTLKAEQTPWIRKIVLTRSIKTWLFFLSLYFGILLAIGHPLRELRVFAWMFVPVVLSTGFTILAFGPFQDWRIARAQRRRVR